MSNRNIYTLPTLLIVAVMTMFASGCSTIDHNLTQEKGVKIKILDVSNSIYVSSANVHEKNNKVVISGFIKKTSPSSGRIRGHVDINVIDPDGKIIAEKTVLPYPGNSQPNARISRFSAFLDMTPPPGSVVLVAAHKGSHS
ncbi:MAG: hypothetical protein KQH63_03375 [Desulfobulbaceae bacterium]|nr:hypothetical protein [Desulfobulbaceae bacterium]